MASNGLPRLTIFWISIFIVSCSSLNMEPSDTLSPEHRLYKDLFEGYLPDARPVKNASHSVDVMFALALNQLLDLDEKNQVLTTSVWIFEEWTDELLTWSPSQYQGQASIMIPATRIWLPDIFIFNTAGDGMDGFVNVNGSKVAIRHDGHVRWMVPLMVSSTCSVDVTYFPYDRQSCQISFGSWIYDDKQVNLLIDTTKPDMENYVMNSEYDLEMVRVSRGVLNSTCCAGDGSHSIVELSLALKRKSLYYDYIVIAPTIMLCVLTLASFLLPCDRGEKMAIGTTVFLTLYVLQLRIADNVPDTNTTPILGVFMLIVMTFNCVSLIMATIVMNIKKRGDDVTCPEVPTWLFALAHHVFGRVVCSRFLWAEDIDIPKDALIPKTGNNMCEECTTTGCQPPDPPNSLFSRPSHCRKTSDSADVYQRHRSGGGDLEMKHRKGGNAWLDDQQTDDVGLSGAREETTLLSHNLVADCVCSQHRGGHRGREDDHETRNIRMRKPLDSFGDDPMETETLLTPTSNKENDESGPVPWAVSKKVDRAFMMKKRWFYVAEVVDKFSFLVYLVLLTTSIFTVLLLIPVYFRNDN